ncbi:MAG: UDP-N-acetylmuramate:L-alanyl-gamma-D-glutamyl-meso-diaminopimelate ligase [Gammaproteobacteria bacterium]|nr:UDP-N-acetylmuramate:L-alanyl-gamma-D-glutamyl-meso-diaminopimelate ligase [Gammaproteobacteria bacterium]
MRVHILGVSGTFMAALAFLARDAGFDVTGSDEHCYPPMSDLLSEKGIQWTEGYEDCSHMLKADAVIVGNAMKRGMTVIETLLDTDIPYFSGPEWLAQHILPRYRVMAVSGTHGKTTTTSMLAHILFEAGLEPGFLIGGVAANFNTSARLGTGEWFVIEADEYDTAFFDKRPKFMHYRPEIAILNNLEFDHADIYANLGEIQKQFHYLLRTIAPKGLVIAPKSDQALQEVMARGVYSHCEHLSLDGDATWCAELLDSSGQAFRVLHHGKQVAEIHWSLIGQFNIENALAAFAASARAGVKPEIAAKALESFIPVKRRLEVKSKRHDICIYDDFAHHPTAINKTIQALKASGRHQRILVVLEFASHTMRTGVHQKTLVHVFDDVDAAYFLKPAEFSLESLSPQWQFSHQILETTDDIVEAIGQDARAGDAVLVMSNRGFEGIHQRLAQRLDQRFS